MRAITAAVFTALIALAAGLFAALAPDAEALPVYAQRSGRTCANCHVSPTLEDPDGWDNPELLKRKCTLSCVACHVDPTGGGLRNSSGRYYGQSTLSMVHTQARSYSDLNRETFSDGTLWKVQQWLGEEVDPNDGDPSDGRTVPSDYEDAQAGMGEGQTGRALQWGQPLGGPAEMAFWDGRYGDLNADPAFQIGGDLRAAGWTGTESFFPMQVDADAAVHPVEHITFAGTVAAKGRTREGPAFFPRRAFGMIHELPGMSWVKAGIFLPSFGLYQDDHTAFTRSEFELDVSEPGDTVAGVEVGAAPNYPYATASVFRTGLYDPAEAGYGSSVNVGFRELGWTLTGHAMMKRRLAGRGNLTAAGITWGFNPAYYLEKLPVTYLGELSVGRRASEQGGEDYAAVSHEVWWMVRNGVNLRGKYDVGFYDVNTMMSLQRRVSAGVELSPVPGVTFTTFARALQAPGDTRWHPDVFGQVHVWF
jgi:hypothetical protein